MGKKWDSPGGPAAYQAQAKLWGEAMLPLLHLGAIVMMFGGTRTWHRLASGMEDAGFEIFDTLMWVYGQGWPKGQNIGKMINRKNGNRAKEGTQIFGRKTRHSVISTEPLSPEAALWSGHNTQLKPSWEPILCFRAPRGKLTYAELAFQFGTGSLNTEEGQGRYPANVILECRCDQTELVPDRFGGGVMMASGGYGKTTAKFNQTYQGQSTVTVGQAIKHTNPLCPAYQLDEQSKVRASRYFYCAKASKKERGDNSHPCVKPIKLTHYLATLLLPPASVAPRRLLVPFSGSGSEIIGAVEAGWDQIVGVEQDADYCCIAEKRLRAW
jgi:hypothetical protein